MSKRVYEIAKELEMGSNELVERINELNLDIKAKTALSSLDDSEVTAIKQALAKSSGPKTEERPVATGVVRRRRRKVVTASDEGVSAAPPAEEPPAAAVPAEEPASTSEPEAPADAVASEEGGDATEPATVIKEQTREVSTEGGGVAVRRRRFVTRTTRPEEDVEAQVDSTEEAPQEEVAASEPELADEASAAPEEVKARPSRFATRVTREVEEEEVVADASADTPDDAQVEDVAPAAPRSRFATVVHARDDEEVDESKRSPVELAELARREADADARKTRGGAQIVGTIDPELLSSRTEHNRGNVRGRGPAGPVDEGRGKKGKKGKRVVQGGELYGKLSRQRNQRKKQKGSGQQTRITTAAEHKRVVKMEEAILVGDLAHQMGVKAGELVMKLAFDLGLRGANINTAVDHDTAQLVAEQYNFKVEQVGFDMSDYLPKYDDSEETLEKRPPVVTVMGHVDHGKTSLLDAIRDSGVSEGEAGGITQHIGAYKVQVGENEVCFLDTPGHEAFTALRARGALATDIVVLVVAADDGVMPQTVEAINHARDAEVPLIVAINKVDKPGANPDRVKQALTEYNLVPEEWGGDTLYVNVSALQRTGIDELLETLHLQSELMDLKANPNRMADGTVIEARLDVGRGPIATVLVQGGTLRVGDTIVLGQHYGRVRTMIDEWGNQLDVAPPSTPVEVTGISGVPSSGEHFYVVTEEKHARAIAEHIQTQAKQAEMAQSATAGSKGGDLDAYLASGEMKELKVIVKGDVQGSVEACVQSIQKLENDEVRVRVVHSGVGSITESDVNLAASSSGESTVLIIGFNVRPEQRAVALADQSGVQVMTHSIIYEMLDEVTRIMTGMLDPIYEEEVLGHAEVRKTFQVSKFGTIAGCMITDGLIRRNARARVLRDNVVVYESSISSLRNVDRDEREMKAGFECGIAVERFNDIKVGDVIEAYVIHERQATI